MVAPAPERNRWPATAAAFAAALCSTTGAWAQQDAADNAEQARVLFEAGGNAAIAGRWEDAAGHFEASLSLVPRPNTRYNLAVALAHLQRHVECLRVLDDLFAHGDPVGDPAQWKLAQDLHASESSAVETVVLRITPPDATVTVDGTIHPGTGDQRTVYLSPASHALEVSSRGFEKLALPVDATAGSRREIACALTPLPKTDPAPPRQRREAPSRAGPVALLIAGSTLLAGAIVTGVLAYRDDQKVVKACDGADVCERPDLGNTQQRAATLALTTDILWPTGGALVVVGAAWLLWAPRNARERPSTSRLTLTAGPGATPWSAGLRMVF